MIYYATILFFTEELFLHNEILYGLKPVSEICFKFFHKGLTTFFSLSHPFHFSMKMTSITRMPVRSFLSFSDFRTYATGLFSNQSKWCFLWAPFPSLHYDVIRWNVCLGERIFFLKLGSNTLIFNACSTVNIHNHGLSSARNIPIILLLLKFNIRSVYFWCSMDSNLQSTFWIRSSIPIF